MSSKTRVVITGLGVISPVGNNVETLWQNIRAGAGGVGPLTRFDGSRLDVKAVAEVKGFNAADHMDAKDAKRMALFTQYAVAAAGQAWRDAGLATEGTDTFRTGVMMGVGIGGKEVDEEAYHVLFEKGPSRLSPLIVPKIITNEACGNISMALGVQGLALAVASACASGADALGLAMDLIRAGRADVMIAGGSEAAITEFSLGGFQSMRALSLNPDPATACRPFDKARDGFVMGEGSAVLILESEAHAKARGAKIYAELAGYGATADAHHLTAPHPDGVGVVKAMRLAMEDAGLAPSGIDYINAHGTSTPLNDPMETKAVKTVFGDDARRVKMSSTKSMTGHLLGAAGAIEAIITTLAIRDGVFPPTINHATPDPECDLDIVPNKMQAGEIRAALSNSLGFGGHNTTLAVKKHV
ncbi:MAG: beta-ketoacyl-ACP synthase II [Kiritimatiellaeota bacterium]|nr:beta-ketoacyl-ACP synthase II [Kiritimatiellota bacterium]